MVQSKHLLLDLRYVLLREVDLCSCRQELDPEDRLLSKLKAGDFSWQSLKRIGVDGACQTISIYIFDNELSESFTLKNQILCQLVTSSGQKLWS